MDDESPYAASCAQSASPLPGFRVAVLCVGSVVMVAVLCVGSVVTVVVRSVIRPGTATPKTPWPQARRSVISSLL